jgi:hypothetical protein
MRFLVDVAGNAMIKIINDENINARQMLLISLVNTWQTPLSL